MLAGCTPPHYRYVAATVSKKGLSNRCNASHPPGNMVGRPSGRLPRIRALTSQSQGEHNTYVRSRATPLVVAGIFSTSAMHLRTGGLLPTAAVTCHAQIRPDRTGAAVPDTDRRGGAYGACQQATRTTSRCEPPLCTVLATLPRHATHNPGKEELALLNPYMVACMVAAKLMGRA